MNKHDRAKLQRRARRMCVQHPGLWMHENSVAKFTAREVDRAIRAERKAWKDAEELRESHLRRADEQLIELAKGLGRK